MVFKRWKVRKEETEISSHTAEKLSLSALSKRVLQARGYDDSSTAELFSQESAFSSPFSLRDMDKAVQRILRAVEQCEPIIVYGDYDADGVTATVVLYTYLENLGADVSWYIPERETEGYGMSKAVIRGLAKKGIKLIITVDNGISAREESDLIYELGMELIITDHHKPGEILPRAEAVVNPHREDCTSERKELCGAGVALKLVCALEGDSYVIDQYADLVALGTVADVVPLVFESRKIVEKGLEMIRLGYRPSLTALLDVCGVEAAASTSESIAFALAPRINAAGRMGSASLAVALLLSDEEDAYELAEEIAVKNKQRQKTEAEILNNIEEQFKRYPRKLLQRVLVVSGEGFHPGVIGIIAARLCEKYGRPVVVIDISDGVGKGSARSIEGFSIYDAFAALPTGILSHFGGHTLAAGLTLSPEAIDDFDQAINEYAQCTYRDMPVSCLQTDCIVAAEELAVEQVESLEKLAPFGAGNPSPMFCFEDAQLCEITSVGEGKHLRLGLRQGDRTVTGMLFGTGPGDFPFEKSDRVKVLFECMINTYRDEKSVTLRIKGIKPVWFEDERYFSGKALFERIMRGEVLSGEECGQAIPDREEIGILYRALKQQDKGITGFEQLYIKLEGILDYCKLRVSALILRELGLIKLVRCGDGFTVELQNGVSADLDNSRLLRSLKESSCYHLEEQGA